MIILTRMTRSDVADRLGQRPCGDDFEQANNVLPDWANVAYSPTEMAAHGVKHSSIMWAWLRCRHRGGRRRLATLPKTRSPSLKR
jgi:hypothetical protein